MCCEEEIIVRVQVLEDGKLPLKAHKTDAGFDLYATEDVTIEKNLITKHPLNIKLELPANTYGLITSKSGLGSKGVLVYSGIIDESYRGIPHVVCANLTHTNVVIKKGQKIAQLIIHPYSTSYVVEPVLCIDENTDRGTGGFGSSGV